jgi:hypothetical protein
MRVQAWTLTWFLGLNMGDNHDGRILGTPIRSVSEGLSRWEFPRART